MDAYQVISLLIVVFGAAWGWNRWLITRIDNGDKNVLAATEESNKQLHKRISDARDGLVPRHEFDREITRVHAELSNVRDEVVRSSERTLHSLNLQGQRIDQILFHLEKRKGE